MHDHMLDCVNEYIDAKQAPYAIMISGEWGSGKTFYWKNVASNSITNINNLAGPIYISLYSIRSIDELKIELLEKISIYKLNAFCINLTDTLKKIGITWKQITTPICHIASFFYKIIRFSAKFFNKEAALYSIPGLIKINNTIICYDDFERCTIDAKDILGFINETVENQNARAIIICNEKDLIKKESYSTYKEKTVRFTFIFTSDIALVFDYFQNSFGTQLQDILRINKHTISSILEASRCKNARTVHYALETLSKFVNAHEVLLNEKPSLSKYIIPFLIAICLETHHIESDEALDKIEQYMNDPKSYYFHNAAMSHETSNDPISKYAGLINPNDLAFPALYQFITTRNIEHDELHKELVSATENITQYDTTALHTKVSLGPFWEYDDDYFINAINSSFDDILKTRITDLGTLTSLFLRFRYFATWKIVNKSPEEIDQIFLSYLDNCFSNRILETNSLEDFILSDLNEAALNNETIKTFRDKAHLLSRNIEEELALERSYLHLSTTPLIANNVINALNEILRHIRTYKESIVDSFDFTKMSDCLTMLSNKELSTIFRALGQEIQIHTGIRKQEQIRFLSLLHDCIETIKIEHHTHQLQGYHFTRISDKLRLYTNEIEATK